MKIGIITQPLHTNYGGLLQAFALQKVLKNEGHEVWLINRYYNQGAVYRFFSFLKQSLLEFFFKGSVYKLVHFRDGLRTELKFRKQYIVPCSGCLSSDEELKKFCRKHRFDVYIVGSDQVWRPAYAPNIYNYFFDFVEDMQGTIFMSYAASFGTSEWEYTTEQTERCKGLLGRFKYISTRESGGVELCRKYLGRNDAVHVLDPTMLLPVSEYIRIIDKAHYPKPNEKFIVSYILDQTAEKGAFLEQVSKKMGKKIYDAKKGLKCNKHLHVKEMATVEEWLYGFHYADFAIIDSFHGCVFSILFHVPFIVIGNKNRGMDRFHSLLSLFNLEDRLITENNLDCSLLSKPIDWEGVDLILKEQKDFSLRFLQNVNNIIF